MDGERDRPSYSTDAQRGYADGERLPRATTTQQMPGVVANGCGDGGRRQAALGVAVRLV